ncbi:MAG: FecR domain-containing protein [Desulfuromonadales bacterium]|nr:FecR domain-containing protein [Desulfuromonadales bacterium]
MRIQVLIMCALLASAAISAAQDDRPIGLVKTASGEVFILRDGRRMAALPGHQLVLGDELSTGATGALGVILRDDTVLSLGPSTETRIEQFAFEPVDQKLGMVLRVTRGLIEYLSGKISKLAPGSVRIETPVATLGVRGTRFVARIVP